MTNFSAAEKAIREARKKPFNYHFANCLTVSLSIIGAAHNIDFGEIDTSSFNAMRRLMRKWGRNYEEALTKAFPEFGFVESELPGEYCPVLCRFEKNKKILGVNVLSGIIFKISTGLKIINPDNLNIIKAWRRNG